MTVTTLMYASLACSAAFFILAGIIYSVRRPAVPPSLPAMADIGPQSPAVANLLANGGTLTPEAVPATLLDLAARKLVQIEEDQPHVYQCRIEFGQSPNLTGYERRVQDLLRSHAVHGVVPAAALTAGPADQAKAWLRSFERDVIDEAKRLGLTEPRWPPRLLSVAGLFTAGSLLLFVIGLEVNNELTFLLLFAGAVAFGTVWLSSIIFRETAQLVTKSGLPMQARWLALRKYLQDDELFHTLPPTAVAVRDRYMAYGAALGVAAAAVRAVPMGAENDRRAWSSYGGRWRQVTVSYPRGWPPAYGASPGETLWRGLRFAGIAALVLFAFYKVMPSLTFAQSSEQGVRDGSAIAVVIAAVAVLAFAVGLWLLLAGLVSLFGVREVTGSAVRVRTFGEVGYLAVDDGTRDHIRAFKVRAGVYASVTEYSNVTVSVTPLLSFVRHVRRASDAVAAEPAAVKA